MAGIPHLSQPRRLWLQRRQSSIPYSLPFQLLHTLAWM